MKVLKIFSLITLLSVFSCNKPTCEDGELNQSEVEIDCGGECELCPIDYPTSSAYGDNVLDKSKTEYVGSSQSANYVHYSFRAYLPEETSLKIHLYKSAPGNGIWWLSSSSIQGWVKGDYTGGQWFESNSDGFIDLEIRFEGTFSAIVDYFENGASTSGTPTFTKTINITE